MLKISCHKSFFKENIAMDAFAYRMAGIAIKAISGLSNVNIRTHGEDRIPKGAVIYAINHFTRIETVFIPYYLNRLTGMPLWSLADYTLFHEGLSDILDRLGAVSTHNPDRDRLIVKTLLTGEAAWIIFPEGRMVKTKKIFEKNGTKKGRFMISSPNGARPPHTGAAALALRTEFYRERIRVMLEKKPDEAKRLLSLYQIDDVEPVLDNETSIVPVNLTYYPLRAHENMLSRMAERFVDNLSPRMVEEIITESTMLLSGVDIDMRFGEPIRMEAYLKSASVRSDIESLAPIGFDDPIACRSMLKKTAHRIMERYMSAIYSMTTVNHDHIFAGLLRYSPDSELREDDFRKRTFLATLFDFEKKGINRHESLATGQISLLTDDRYQKYANFIGLAIEKDVVRKKDGALLRESGFSDSFDFHRVRIDNPLAVIANEIEPLTEFDSYLRVIARMPDLRLRYLIRKYLLEKAILDFKRDCAGSADADVNRSNKVGVPFLLKGKSRNLGILLLHGYMAAPLEVRALAEYLNKGRGWWVYVARLSGHGTSPEDLAARSYMEWVESAEEGYSIIANTCRKVVVGGFSTGAGLALDLCTRVSSATGVFAISPPMKLQDFSARFVPAINLWNRLMDTMNVESAKKEFIENHPENPHINYLRNPISGILELERLMDQLEPKISAIDVAALVIQSLSDPVVHHGGAFKIFQKIGSENKELLMVNYLRHGIINGPGSGRIFSAVAEFVDRQLP